MGPVRGGGGQPAGCSCCATFYGLPHDSIREGTFFGPGFTFLDRGKGTMAKRVIFVSDLTGQPIDEKNAATVTIKYADARRGQVVLDVNASEVDDLAARGQKQARRGRRPKNAT